MKCTVTLGHDSTLVVRAEDGRTGTFRYYQRTLTGVRNKYGEAKALTASNLLDHLRIRGALRKPYDRIQLPNDRGIFDEITAVDLAMGLRKIHAHIDVCITVLRGAVKICEKKKKI